MDPTNGRHKVAGAKPPPMRMDFMGREIVVQVDESTIDYEGPSDSGHGLDEYSFEAVGQDGSRYVGFVDGAPADIGIMHWDSAELVELLGEAPTMADPRERMYDLHQKGPNRTPEENEELRNLVNQHGRAKFMSKNKNTMTRQADVPQGPDNRYCAHCGKSMPHKKNNDGTMVCNGCGKTKYWKKMTRKQMSSWVSRNCRFAMKKTARHSVPGCSYCEEHKGDPMMPDHDASPGCESGKKNHCTCDVCY